MKKRQEVIKRIKEAAGKIGKQGESVEESPERSRREEDEKLLEFLGIKKKETASKK